MLDEFPTYDEFPLCMAKKLAARYVFCRIECEMNVALTRWGEGKGDKEGEPLEKGGKGGGPLTGIHRKCSLSNRLAHIHRQARRSTAVSGVPRASAPETRAPSTCQAAQAPIAVSARRCRAPRLTCALSAPWTYSPRSRLPSKSQGARACRTWTRLTQTPSAPRWRGFQRAPTPPSSAFWRLGRPEISRGLLPLRACPGGCVPFVSACPAPVSAHLFPLPHVVRIRVLPLCCR